MELINPGRFYEKAAGRGGHLNACMRCAKGHEEGDEAFGQVVNVTKAYQYWAMANECVVVRDSDAALVAAKEWGAIEQYTTLAGMARMLQLGDGNAAADLGNETEKDDSGTERESGGGGVGLRQGLLQRSAKEAYRLYNEAAEKAMLAFKSKLGTEYLMLAEECVE